MCSKMEVRFTRAVRIYNGLVRAASAHRGGALIKIESRGGGLGPIEAAGVAQTTFAETFAKGSVGRHRAKFSRDVVNVLGVENQRGVPDDFAQRATI